MQEHRNFPSYMTSVYYLHVCFTFSYEDFMLVTKQLPSLLSKIDPSIHSEAEHVFSSTYIYIYTHAIFLPFLNSKGILRLVYWKKTKQILLSFLVERQMDPESIYFYCSITLQKASTNVQQSSPLLCMLFGFILYKAVNRFNDMQKVFSRCWSFLQPQSRIGSLKAREDSNSQYSESFNEQLCFDKKKDDTNLCREEVKTVMENLGLFYGNESEELEESMGSKELSQLFDQEEASLEEVKEAFGIFDEKGKGFIDEEDLQRVLHKLKFKERFDLESCRKMIKKFDDNGDGIIDFTEFVKFMENSFC